jgi:hypothetical protein
MFFFVPNRFFFAPDEKQKINFLTDFFSGMYITVNVENYINKQCHFFTLERQVICFLQNQETRLFSEKKPIAPLLRDRPFNLKRGGGGYGFLFRSEFFFRTTQELEYFFLPCKAQFFFPEFNIRLYDNNSESDYFFFPPPKSEYFFQQHLESEYFFRKKP